MYDYIKGELAELTPATAVIEAGGVGYFIHISLQTYSQLEGSAEAKLYVHHIVRDDAMLFFGFATKAEREVFRLLIGVSGVGAVTARMILSTYTSREVASMISTENTLLLKNVKGLGLKTAQKIVLELRDKILGVVSDPEGGTLQAAPAAGAGNVVTDEALSALTMLGFSKASSEKVVRAIVADNPGMPVEQVIRMALKKL